MQDAVTALLLRAVVQNLSRRTKELVAACVVAKLFRKKCRCDAALAQCVRIFVRLRNPRIESMSRAAKSAILDFVA